MTSPSAQLAMGPILFHWNPEKWKDFYFQVADEAPVETVYLGEVICAKRSPFYEPLYDEVSRRLRQAGKKVVFSTLAEVMVPHERKLTESMCGRDGFLVEANDAAALYHLCGKPHAVGPFVNVYNEDTLSFLVSNGAVHATLPPELPAGALAVLGRAAQKLGVTLEVQVFGRVPLALSARCYHARAHGRVKDNCQYVCGEDPDGMDLRTLEGTPFLTVNGVQTLSHTYLNLMQEMGAMQAMGIGTFRLSPHSQDMIEVAHLFRAVLDGHVTAAEGSAKLKETGFGVQFANGFFHRREGHRWLESGNVQDA